MSGRISVRIELSRRISNLRVKTFVDQCTSDPSIVKWDNRVFRVEC